MAFFVANTEVFNNSAEIVGSSFSNIVQVRSYSTTNNIRGSLGGSSNPNSASGTSYFTFNFTPIHSDSTLWLYSSNVAIHEYSNSNDVFHMGAFYDSTRITSVNCPILYNKFGDNYNTTWLQLNKTFASWGTNQKTIDIRVGAGNGRGNDIGVNINDYTGVSGTIVFTMAEFR